MPDFFIVGAQKSGTTALYNHLKQHPQILMSAVKEPHYFAFANTAPDFPGPRDNDVVRHQFVLDETAYLALFDRTNDGQVVAGEASAMYLCLPDVASRIQEAVPDAKIIALLRNPVDRAYSSYQHLVRDGRETENTFAAALAAEPERVAAGWIPLWHYVGAGRYGHQLQCYFDHFPREHIKVVLYDDFIAEPAEVMKQLYSFLGVFDDFAPEVEKRYNTSGVHRNRATSALYKFMLHPPNHLTTVARRVLPPSSRRKIMDTMTEVLRNRYLERPPPVEEWVRRELIDVFESDRAQLAEMLGRDLSRWATV